jgi:hypothetical protein
MENLENRLNRGFMAFTEGYGFRARISPNKIIFKNADTEIQFTYDKLRELYIVSFSTKRKFNKIKLKSDGEGEIWVDYKENIDNNVLSVSNRSLIIAENNVKTLVKDYSLSEYHSFF